MDDLATLIRLSKLALDEKRKAMVRLEQQAAAVQQEIDKIDEALETERQQTPNALEGGLTQGAFIQASRKKREILIVRLSTIHKQIEAAQDEIRIAFEEVKRYEIAEEQRASRQAKDQKRRETKALDEMGSERQRRKETET